MPLAKKTTSTVLPEALQAQIHNNFTKEEPETVVPEPKPAEKSVSETQKTTPAAAEKVTKAKSKYADSVNLRLTSGKRNEFKMFFMQCEISMNQGFETAVDYLIKEVKAGHIKVSRTGVTKLVD